MTNGFLVTKIWLIRWTHQKYFRKYCFSSCYSQRVWQWHGLLTVTNVHTIQKTTRNSQKLGNKLASRWQKIQGSKQREIKLISKKVWRKRKDIRKNWLVLHVKQYINCCWRTCIIRKCTHILLVDDHDEVAMCNQQTN